MTTTEVFDDKDAFLAALNGAQPKAKAKDARPNIPRAPKGEGDRLGQLKRIAAYGYSPRFDADQGFSFWNCRTGARTTACAGYAEACIAAERELSAS